MRWETRLFFVFGFDGEPESLYDKKAYFRNHGRRTDGRHQQVRLFAIGILGHEWLRVRTSDWLVLSGLLHVQRIWQLPASTTKPRSSGDLDQTASHLDSS